MSDIQPVETTYIRPGRENRTRRTERTVAQSIIFAGRTFELEIALYIFKFLCGHFDRTWRTKRGRCRNRQSFVWGMYRGLFDKLDEQMPKEPQREGIVLSRQHYLNKLFPDMYTQPAEKPEVADKAAMAGYIEGQNTELRKGVEKTGVGQMQLTL